MVTAVVALPEPMCCCDTSAVEMKLQTLFSTGKFHWQLTRVQDFTINILKTICPLVSLGLF